MFKTTQTFCNDASFWIVTLTEQGQANFREVCGDSLLVSRQFIVQLPRQEGRTERGLCEQVRRAGVQEIAKQSHKNGLAVSLNELAQLETFDAIRCRYLEEEARCA
jgi:hypothetical protein